MKTKRRQELKSNDLAVYLQELSQTVRDHSSKIIIGAVAVIAVIVIVGLRTHFSSSALETGWRSYQNVVQASYTTDPEEPDWLDGILRQWDAVVETSANSTFRAQAIWGYTDFCLRQFLETSDPKVKTRLLDQAEQNCRVLLRERSASLATRAAALSALATVEQNRFVLDGSPEHRDAARRHLEQIRDDPQFAGTPFQAEALQRLNDFEGLWEPLVLVDPPAEPPTGDPTGESSEEESLEEQPPDDDPVEDAETSEETAEDLTDDPGNG